FGLNEKEISVYKTLIEGGPSAVRTIALKSGVNRGTTYDILKSLRDQGLVSYFNKKTHQYFAAEPPEKLVLALETKQKEIELVKQQVAENLPELKSLFEQEGGRPQVKLYEGKKGIYNILQDVLWSMNLNRDKKYYVYSSSSVRKNVHLAMPEFNKER